MLSFKKIIKKPVKGTKGFTLMELMVVVALISVLSTIAMLNYIPIRAKALDAAAMSDARNIVDSVIDTIVNYQDVDFTKNFTGGAVGSTTSGGAPRTPVFVLSPGVSAVIIGDSIQNPGGNNTVFSAYIYHTGGTPDPASIAGSGRKEFFCFVDEDTGTTIVPNY